MHLVLFQKARVNANIITIIFLEIITRCRFTIAVNLSEFAKNLMNKRKYTKGSKAIKVPFNYHIFLLLYKDELCQHAQQ